MNDLLVVQSALTLKMALFVGVYLVAAASAMMRPSLAGALLENIKASPGAMHATGALAAFVGMGALVAHCDFTSVTAALVTLTAIWWAIEGVALLALGHVPPIDSAAAIKNYARSNILALLIGIFLIIAGVFGRAELPS